MSGNRNVRLFNVNFIVLRVFFKITSLLWLFSIGCTGDGMFRKGPNTLTGTLFEYRSTSVLACCVSAGGAFSMFGKGPKTIRGIWWSPQRFSILLVSKIQATNVLLWMQLTALAFAGLFVVKSEKVHTNLNLAKIRVNRLDQYDI